MRKLAIAATAALLMSGPMFAADHGETPGVDADPAADLADIFFFQANGKVVGVMTFGGRPAPRSRIDIALYCDTRLLYTFNIDRNNDNVADEQIFARFGRDSRDNCGLQLTGVPGSTAAFNGPVETVFTNAAGLKAFAGLRDDPFFFDVQGFNATVAKFTADDNSPATNPLSFVSTRDSFGNRNISVIAFEMDAGAVFGSSTKVRAWGVTSRLPG